MILKIERKKFLKEIIDWFIENRPELINDNNNLEIN